MYNLPDPMPFYKLVWEIVRQIPEGAVATYGQIAGMIPPPEGIQRVFNQTRPRGGGGDAITAAPRVDEPTIPWHRVINGKGGISLPENSKAAALQRARLRAEAVLLGSDERVSLDEFGWDGPDAKWIDERGLRAARPLRKPKDDAPRQMSLF